MFSRILVALDGSKLAECAIAPACEIARKFANDLIVLRVIGVARQAAVPAGAGSPQPDLQSVEAEFEREAAQDYLRDIQARFLSAGVKVKAEVVMGEPATAIKAMAEDQNVDLIVMSTHGRSGILRLLYGSVAEAVLRGAHTPLLLIPVNGGGVIAGNSHSSPQVDDVCHYNQHSHIPIIQA